MGRSGERDVHEHSKWPRCGKCSDGHTNIYGTKNSREGEDICIQGRNGSTKCSVSESDRETAQAAVGNQFSESFICKIFSPCNVLNDEKRVRRSRGALERKSVYVLSRAVQFRNKTFNPTTSSMPRIILWWDCSSFIHWVFKFNT